MLSETMVQPPDSVNTSRAFARHYSLREPENVSDETDADVIPADVGHLKSGITPLPFGCPLISIGKVPLGENPHPPS